MHCFRWRDTIAGQNQGRLQVDCKAVYLIFCIRKIQVSDMIRAAAFEKVSYDRFAADWEKNFPGTAPEEIARIYAGLRLPRRATAGSAGYDICAPVDIEIAPGQEILIPTGLRVRMREDYVLMLFPRSGLGFKYRLQMNNTVGIIDSDYYGADNEGHIFCKLTNDSRQGKTVLIREGDGMVQGIFVPFGITEDDEADGVRTGGFGSTTESEHKHE